MTAQEARQLTSDHQPKSNAPKRIDSAIKNILDSIRRTALEGRNTVLFAPGGLMFDSESDQVRRELEKLGYGINNEKDQNLNYQMITW